MSSTIEKLSFANFSPEIKELNDQFRGSINVFNQNLKDFQERMEDAKASLFKNSSTQQNIQEKIQQAFDSNIGKTIIDLLDYISDKLTTTDYNFLFNIYFAEKILKVLEGILEFEKKVSEIVPSESEKIMKIFENCIINLVVIQFPVIGILIKTTNMIDKIHDFFDMKNLNQTIIDWHKRIIKIKETTIEFKNNINLTQAFEIAEQTEILANYIEVPVTDILNLGLKSESMAKVYDLVQNNIKEKDFLVIIANSLKQIPNNKQKIQQKLNEIKVGITEIITGPQAFVAEIKVLQEKINKHLDEINKDLTIIVGFDKSFVEKLSLCQKVVNSISSIINEIKKTVKKAPAGIKIIKELEDFIEKKVVRSIFPTSLLMLREYSPVMLEILGITNAFRVKFVASFSNISSKAASTSQGRAG